MAGMLPMFGVGISGIISGILGVGIFLEFSILKITPSDNYSIIES